MSQNIKQNKQDDDGVWPMILMAVALMILGFAIGGAWGYDTALTESGISAIHTTLYLKK